MTACEYTIRSKEALWTWGLHHKVEQKSGREMRHETETRWGRVRGEEEPTSPHNIKYRLSTLAAVSFQQVYDYIISTWSSSLCTYTISTFERNNSLLQNISLHVKCLVLWVKHKYVNYSCSWTCSKWCSPFALKTDGVFSVIKAVFSITCGLDFEPSGWKQWPSTIESTASKAERHEMCVNV